MKNSFHLVVRFLLLSSMTLTASARPLPVSPRRAVPSVLIASQAILPPLLLEKTHWAEEQEVELVRATFPWKRLADAAYARTLGRHITVHHPERMPQTNAVIIANHVNYFGVDAFTFSFESAFGRAMPAARWTRWILHRRAIKLPRVLIRLSHKINRVALGFAIGSAIVKPAPSSARLGLFKRFAERLSRVLFKVCVTLLTISHRISDPTPLQDRFTIPIDRHTTDHAVEVLKQGREHVGFFPFIPKKHQIEEPHTGAYWAAWNAEAPLVIILMTTTLSVHSTSDFIVKAFFRWLLTGQWKPHRDFHVHMTILDVLNVREGHETSTKETAAATMKWIQHRYDQNGVQHIGLSPSVPSERPLLAAG